MDTDQLTHDLGRCYSGILHDVMRGAGLKDFTLPHTLVPLREPDAPLIGPAFTMLGGLVDDASAHDTLMGWTGFLSRTPGGHVVVIQPQDSTVAHMGELSAETLHRKGVRGVVVDGGCRDVRFINAIGLPVWSRYRTPRDVVSAWMPKAFDVPIAIGPVVIHPGDWMFADADGVIRIPADRVGAVVTEALALIATENKVRTAILAGVDPQQAYLQFRKF